MRQPNDDFPDGHGSDRDEGLDRWARRWLVPLGYALIFIAFAYWIYGLKIGADRAAHIHQECGVYATMKCIEEAGKAFADSNCRVMAMYARNG